MLATFFTSLSKKKVLLIATILLVLLVFFRFSFGGFNFSHFVVAGSDFAVADSLHPHFIINEGQGYDGQFFYRYAHAPLDTAKTAYGVTVDHIEYRMQRIVYPAAIWFFSGGGSPGIIPFLMVFFNLLAFIGLIVLSLKIVEYYKSGYPLALLPLLLFGVYMSLARDTSELFEVFFFVVAVYAIIKNNIFMFLIGVLLAIFSRETSILAIAPLTFIYGIKLLKENQFNGSLILKGMFLALPFLLLAAWKYYLHQVIDSEQLVDGSQNLSYPFYGMYYGAKNNLNFSTTISILESLFWFVFFSWNVWLVGCVLKIINYKKLVTLDVSSMLSLVYLGWLIFALFLGPAIYVDDWGYVRVFGLWNMLGFLLIMIKNKPLNPFFLIYSYGILGLLLIRLIVRV